MFLYLQVSMAEAQETPLFGHQQWYKIEDGLPQGFITGIVQDKAGFIWAGTLDGIVRFDGKQFKSYKYDPNDTLSLSANSTSRLSMTKKGRILVESYESNTVDELNPELGTFQSLSKRPTLQEVFKSFVLINYSNDLWSFTHLYEGAFIGWHNPITGKQVIFKFGKELMPGDSIFSPAIQLQNGHWAFPSVSALYLVDSNLRNPVRYPFPEKKMFKPRYGSEHSNIYAMADGRLAIPALMELILWDPRSQQFTSKKFTDPKLQEQPCFLQTGPDGFCYFALGTRIYRLEAGNKLTLVWENRLVPDRRITSLLIDRSNVLWAGLDAAGIIRVNLQSIPFTAISNDSLFHYKVLTRLGMPQKLLPKPVFVEAGPYHFRYSQNKREGGYFFSCYVNEKGEKPVMYYQNGKITHLPIPASNIHPGVTALTSSSTGEIWAYEEFGFRIFYWRNRNEMARVFNLSKTELALHNGMGYDMLVLGGFVWLSTNGNGLFKIKEDKVVQWFHPKASGHKLPSNLTDLCVDPRDSSIFWIGSLGSGMFRFDSKTGNSTVITIDQGLPNNTVYAIEPDKEGYFWLSTNKGIARFDPATGIFHNFEKNDGLPGNEFNRSHNFQYPDGRIAFGGTEGMVLFNPAHFKVPVKNVNTRLQITGIEVNNIPQIFGANGSLIDSPLNQIRHLRLPHNRNFVTVHFAALLFNDPQKIRYRYRLLGVEDDWNEAGNANIARYTQLRPGNYTLQLNATGFDGWFTPHIRELYIVVSPPFWATWWAYLVYLLTALIAFRQWRRYRQKRQKEKAQLAIEHQEAERLRELDRIKEQFFSNMTHELRTPITLITAPLEQLMLVKDLPEKAITLLQSARNNSDRLLHLINDILDINKLEAGYLKLQETIGEPSRFFASCVQKFSVRAAEKQIELNADFKKMEGYYQFDRDKWETLLFNLLSNAIKFTPSGGKIQVAGTVSETNDKNKQFEITVADTGMGISQAELAQVFNRFYQADKPNSSYTGTGIGLALVKELVQLMNGSISVESSPGKGSSFLLKIPAQKVSVAASEQVEMSQVIIENEQLTSHSAQLAKPENLLLLVEDNDELRQYISQVLEQDWRIVTAKNGQEGWGKMLAEMPDLVLSDLIMPLMNGNELCMKCKSDTRTAHIPFMLLTSRASIEGKMEGLSSGADEYLTKPFHVQELQMRLSNMLSLRDRQRQYWQEQMKDGKAKMPAMADPFVQQLYELIDERLDDLQLGVEDLCRRLGLSQSSLNRKLQALLGLTANDFIRNYRLKKAAELILSGYDASQAAYMTGFSSPSYFSKRFKEYFGTTPSSYLTNQ